MRPEQIGRLACAVHALRPDWPASSLRTFIARNLASDPVLDASLALLWVALDPTTQSPGRVLERQGVWWRAGNPDPSAAPAGAPPSVRDHSTCRICHRAESACRAAAALTGDPHDYTPRTPTTKEPA